MSASSSMTRILPLAVGRAVRIQRHSPASCDGEGTPDGTVYQPPRLALDFDRAAMLLNDTVGDRKPRPVPLRAALVVKNGS